MRSLRPYLIALLALSTVALGGLSWQQYQEIIRLRAAALDSDVAAKALQAQLKHPKPLEAQAKEVSADEVKKPEATEDDPNQPGDRRGRRDERFAAMRAVMASPEFQKAMALQSQAQIEGRFAALFKKLNLPPEALEKFKSLLAEKQNAVRDAMEVAREQGLNGRDNRDQIRDVIKQTQAELDDSIRNSIGDAAYSQYQQYEQTQPQRTTASQLTNRLSYTQTPLTDTQYEQLVQTLAASGKTQTDGFRTFTGGGPGGPGGALGGGLGTNGTNITNDVVTAASAYLTTPQLNTLSQLQAEQQAARKAQQLLRDAAQAARQNGGTSGTSGGTSGGATTPPTKGGKP